MVDKQREAVVAEISRLRVAIMRTQSKYLVADYSKAIKRLERELADYDRFRQEVR